MPTIVQIPMLILLFVPGFCSIACTVIIIGAILRGEITTTTGWGFSPKVSRTYKAGTFSFWLQIVGFLLLILLFAFMQWSLLPWVMEITGYEPDWLVRLCGEEAHYR